MMYTEKLSKWVLIFVFFLYSASLFLPAVYTQYDPSFPNDILYMTGGKILHIGWMGVFIGQFAWFANLTIFVSVVFFLNERYKASLITSIIGLLLSMNTFSLRTFPRNEGGDEYVVTKLGLGFYFWEASLLALLIIALYEYLRIKKQIK